MNNSSTNVAAPPLGLDPLRALLDASAMLLASSSPSRILSGIVDLAGKVITADAYAVWRTYDGVHWRVLASEGLPDGYRNELSVPEPLEVRFEAIRDVTENPLVSKHSALYSSYGIRSLLVVPLQLNNAPPDGPNAGTITFYWRSTQSFDDLHVAYASALANLSSAALNLADLTLQNQRERARIAFLADASAVLSS